VIFYSSSDYTKSEMEQHQSIELYTAYKMIFFGPLFGAWAKDTCVHNPGKHKYMQIE